VTEKTRPKKERPLVTGFDRALSRVAPRLARDRVKARFQFEMMAAATSRTAAGSRGTMGNWVTNRLSAGQEAREQYVVSGRAQDLIANDAFASSLVESVGANAVGSGLTPQAQPDFRALGITEEQAREVAEQVEGEYRKWAKQADITRNRTFAEVQLLAARQLVGPGEFLILPLWDDQPQRYMDFRLQVLEPDRLGTPSDRGNYAGKLPGIIQGVELDKYGCPVGYHIASPTAGRFTGYLTSRDYKFYRAWVGHRRGVLHSFFLNDGEQVRGMSVLAPAMKLYRDLGDYLDFETVGAIMAAAFVVAIQTKGDLGDLADLLDSETSSDGDTTYYKEFRPAQVAYLNEGEEAKVLENKRPSGQFETFVKTVQKALAASAGLTYEVVARDFSETNYSSARASLMEAWKTFLRYRRCITDHLCEPTWRMVWEEAWLRGRVRLPRGAPDFYDAMEDWTAATWIGPARGYVDPEKEIRASVERIKNNLGTMANEIAGQGEDWEATLAQRKRERDRLENLGLNDPADGGNDGSGAAD
jgi:lambda family phage portal protein